MKSYLSPKTVINNPSNFSLKMQASGETLAAISCGGPSGNTTCTDVPRGASCFSLDNADALIFLPGTSAVSHPDCTLIVNGHASASCSDIFLDDVCEGGANWNISCEGSYQCDGSDTIQVQCAGFETSSCGEFV